MGTSPEMSTFRRCINFIQWSLLPVFLSYNFADWGKMREKRSLPPTSLNQLVSKNLVLSGVTPFLSNGEPLPPNIKMIGPSLLLTETNQISVDLQKWLSESKPVVYVAFGTTAIVTEREINLVVQGLKSDKFRVLWSLKKIYRDILPPDMPDSFRLEEYVPQIGILEHPNVKVFVSHGGYNSIHESLGKSKPMLLIPFFGDQVITNTPRAVQKGVGLSIDRVSATPQEVAEKIERLLTEESFHIRAKEAAKIISLGKSAQKGADAIEEAIILGIKHLIPVYADLPLYQLFFLDVAAVFLSFAILLVWSVRKCWRFSRKKIKHN